MKISLQTLAILYSPIDGHKTLTRFIYYALKAYNNNDKKRGKESSRVKSRPWLTIVCRFNLVESKIIYDQTVSNIPRTINDAFLSPINLESC